MRNPAVPTLLAVLFLAACGGAEPAPSASTTFSLGAEDDWFDQALAARNAGDLDTAETALQNSLVANPRYLAAILALGDLQYERSRFAESEATFRSAVALRDRTPDAHLGLARAIFAQGRYAEATDAANRAIQTSIDAGVVILHGEALVTRARIELAINDLQAATLTLDEALRVDSTNTEARVARARLTAQQGDINGAVQMLARAESFETDTGLLRNIGILYYDMRLDERCIEAMSRAVELGSTEEMVQYYLAAANLRLGRRDVGIELAAELIRRNPSHLGAHVVRGRGELERNYPDRALADATLVLNADPTHYGGLMLRGDVRRVAGDLAGAEQDYLQAFQLQSGLLDAPVGLADLYFAQNRYSDFIEVVQPRVRVGWAPADWRSRLSDAYLAVGDHGAAITLRSELAMEVITNSDLNYQVARLALDHPGHLASEVVVQHANHAYQNSNRSVDFLLLMVEAQLADGNCVQAENFMELATRGYASVLRVRELQATVDSCR
jgi:tetratricopeptide (TPR) repeat protein